MTKATATTYANKEINSLPTGMRHPVAMQKYVEAVRIYSETDTPLSDIAMQCGVTPGGLSNYISRHHRDLLLKKYGIKTLDCAVRIKRREEQSLHTHYKYKEAILASSDVAYIEFNISQIAEIFGLNPSSLASQLRFHYPDVIPERERIRRRLGLADNIHRGARPYCVEAYADAVAMYRDTDMTIRDVAEACKVSTGGLSQHLLFYNKSVVVQKAARRDSCASNDGEDRSGTLSGNGRLYGPDPMTVEKYAEALELYRTSSMTMKEIVKAAGVPYEGFRSYIRQWHRKDRDLRLACNSAVDKYRPAILSLQENPRPISVVAAEFGFNPEVFREYLKRHESDLAAKQGMTRGVGGKLVKRISEAKYAKAIEEYATSAEPLKAIAQRHGLVYNSLSAYVRRNCPAERESHRKILESLADTTTKNEQYTT
ncbi:MAG: hypothetical protein K2G77_01080 [Muribaculaceae bacterium]|nr:hypothetical protein [Muribaculaceae bacterium]